MRHHSDIPLWECSNPMPIVHNEPNSRQGRVGRGQRGVGREENVQNEPNLPPPDGQAAPWLERIVRNEPNLPPAALGPAGPIARNKANFTPGRCRARTPNPRRAEGLSCETNPISRRGRMGRGMGGLSCETNPISPVGPAPGGPNAQNKPNLESQMCKTNPISPVGPGPRTGKYAKRTEFFDCGLPIRDTPLRPCAWVPAGESCKTNPISADQDIPPFHYSTLPIRGLRRAFSLALAAGGQHNARSEALANGFEA